MKPALILVFLISMGVLSCTSQTNNTAKAKGMSVVAATFLHSLSTAQKAKVQYPFDQQERFNWHYIPKDRNGITLGELSTGQLKAAMDLLHACLSDSGYNKANAIIKLESVLRQVEGRQAGDNYRDPGNYHVTLFGNPEKDAIWGWRLEGHHISFNFSTENNTLVSGTPGFLGANPAVVLSGPEKGTQVLKDETTLGFTLLNSLDAKQMEKAVINTEAPGDIITAASRKAMINDPKGLLYGELNEAQQKYFLRLLSIYIHRYTKLFAMDMMHDIEKAGLTNLRFAWAGARQPGLGNPHYYRLQGPTIIIEYDNTQNNANHVHTIVRDLKHDFGGDELLEHYKEGHNR